MAGIFWDWKGIFVRVWWQHIKIPTRLLSSFWPVTIELTSYAQATSEMPLAKFVVLLVFWRLEMKLQVKFIAGYVVCMAKMLCHGQCLLLVPMVKWRENFTQWKAISWTLNVVKEAWRVTDNDKRLILNKILPHCFQMLKWNLRYYTG